MEKNINRSVTQLNPIVRFDYKPPKRPTTSGKNDKKNTTAAAAAVLYAGKRVHGNQYKLNCSYNRPNRCSAYDFFLFFFCRRMIDGAAHTTLAVHIPAPASFPVYVPSIFTTPLPLYRMVTNPIICKCHPPAMCRFTIIYNLSRPTRYGARHVLVRARTDRIKRIISYRTWGALTGQPPARPAIVKLTTTKTSVRLSGRLPSTVTRNNTE